MCCVRRSSAEGQNPEKEPRIAAHGMDDEDKKVVKYVWTYELLFGNARNREVARTIGLIFFLPYYTFKFLVWVFVGLAELLSWLIGTREGQITSLLLLAGYGLIRVGMDIWGPVNVPAAAPAPVAIATPLTAPSAGPSIPILPPVAVLPPPVASSPPKPSDRLTLMNEVRPVLADSPIHAGPDASTPIKDWVHAGGRVRILGKQGDFYVVRKLNGQFGFVRQADIGDRS
jgi:hypothetical protein